MKRVKIYSGGFNMKNWYKNRFRRNLIDMHIEDWNNEFLSQFDPDVYYENLKEGDINAPMIYIQSHVGLCYWPTKNGKMHEAFRGREDLMKRLFDNCHSGGMDVIAYYSLIYNNWAYKNHPEWRMRDINGKASRDDGSRYGLCCPNSQGYRNFVKEQIIEFCAYFDFEGIFLDMTFWPMVCYCDDCKERWEKEIGGSMPVTLDWNDPQWVKFQRKRTEWLGEFAQFATAEIKKHKNECTVEHQYSPALHFWRFGVTENITEASDYAGGDLYGGIAEQSFACKVYYNLTKNQPFEYMTCRCYKSLNEHTTNKSEDLLKLSVMMTYLHHGACLLIDAIDPAGTIDSRVYKKIGKIYREAEAFEPWLSTGEHSYDVGLYLNMFSKMNSFEKSCPVKDIKDTGQPHEDAVKGAANILRSHHVPYSVLNNWKLDLINKVKILVLPDIPFLEAPELEAVKNFIKNGGAAYISGRTVPALIEEIFGVKFEGFTNERVSYISPSDEGLGIFKGEFTKQYPLAMFEVQPKYTGKPAGKIYGAITLPYTKQKIRSDFMDPSSGGDGGKQIDLDSPDYRFASIHSNPPGILTSLPAMMMTEYGKGKVFYSTLPVERAEREQHGDIFAGIIELLMGDKDAVFSSEDAPETVECILFDDQVKKIKLLGLINVQEGFHTIPTGGFTVSVYSETAPVEVLALPDKKPVPYKYEDHHVKIRIDGLHIYKMLSIQY
jgi:hypothetical protein